MKTKKKQIKYTEDLGDSAGFEGAKPLTKEQAAALGIPTPAEAAGMRVVRTHGGPRAGAGRKSKGHVRMQILVSATVRKQIEKLAKQRKTTMSAIVEERFTRS